MTNSVTERSNVAGHEPTLQSVWSELELLAREHHVLAIGASPVEDLHASFFADWLERGQHGTMQYLQRHLAIRQSPQTRYPWARSVIAIAVPYSPRRPETSGTLAAHIARYAQGDDYHDVLDEILRAFEVRIQGIDSSVKTWRYVDTGPLSDRSMAEQAGLGWIGLN